MTLVVPNAGEAVMLANLLNKTAPLLDALFTTVTPVLIVVTGGGRVYAPVTYEPARAAIVG